MKHILAGRDVVLNKIACLNRLKSLVGKRRERFRLRLKESRPGSINGSFVPYLRDAHGFVILIQTGKLRMKTFAVSYFQKKPAQFEPVGLLTALSLGINVLTRSIQAPQGKLQAEFS